MSTKRFYYVMLGSFLGSFILLLLGVYGANVMLQHESSKLVENRTRSLVLDKKQQQLTQARASIAKYQALAEIAKHIVPQDKDQAQTVREIVNIAEANNIKLGSITFPSSSLGVATSPSKSALSQLKAVKNIPGVYSLEITVQSDTSSPAQYSRFVNFLDALEHNRRTALVSGISLQPDSNNPSKLTFSLNLSEYIKP